MLRFISASLFFLMIGGVSYSQGDSKQCHEGGGSTDSKVACLDNKIKELNERLTALEKPAGQNLAVKSAPPFVFLQPYIRATRGHWALPSAGFNDAECPNLPGLPGYVLIRLPDRFVNVRVGRGRCQAPPYCDSHREYCEDIFVDKACLVRQDVYDYIKASFRWGDHEMIFRLCANST